MRSSLLGPHKSFSVREKQASHGVKENASYNIHSWLGLNLDSDVNHSVVSVLSNERFASYVFFLSK